MSLDRERAKLGVFEEQSKCRQEGSIIAARYCPPAKKQSTMKKQNEKTKAKHK